MKKTGKYFVFCFFAFLFAFTPFLSATAQNNLSVEATVSEATIYTGGRLKLNITVSGDFDKIAIPDLPEISGFRLINPVPSTSRQFSYRNGATSTSYTYSYFLAVQEEGNYTIPPVSVEIDGEQHQTQSINVRVIDRSAGEGDTPSTGPGIFLRMNVSDRNVVPGEQIIANVVLYFKDNLQVNTYQPIPGWKAEGFWKEQLESSRRPQVQPFVIDGVRYNKARLLQFALFPTKTGELTISPYQVNVLVNSVSRRSRNPFSSFFGSFSSNRRRLELETEPVTVDVEPLPEAANENYIGAVGSFAIQRKINADSVQAGETIEIITTISGSGNVPLLTKPEYDLPSGLEVYQPQTDVQINRSGARIRGSKTFTDVVVPRNAGPVTIPATTLTWYSPSQGDFVEEELPAKTIFVQPSANGVTAVNNPDGGMIAPVTGLVNWSSSGKKVLIHYWWFWAGLLLPLLGLMLGYWRKTYNEKMSGNYNFARSQQAVDVANDRLQQSLDHADNGHLKEAYNNLQKALTGFIGDKLGMAEAGLSIEQYVEALKERNVNNDLIKNVHMLLNKSATVNYAPDMSSDYLKSHVGLAESIIKKLRKEL